MSYCDCDTTNMTPEEYADWKGSLPTLAEFKREYKQRQVELAKAREAEAERWRTGTQTTGDMISRRMMEMLYDQLSQHNDAPIYNFILSKKANNP